MVQTLAYCFGRVAPYYNLVLAIVVIFLFIKLFKIGGKKTDLKPWKFLFMAVLVYLGEEIITVLSMANLIVVPKIIFPLFEMIIITLFIYVLLSHKENTKK
tara:strand:- start:3 stop:305 length:303 start_codon:yes stop_codon:yes gene_type:complete